MNLHGRHSGTWAQFFIYSIIAAGSALAVPPSGFIPVPPNPACGTTDTFYVAKYEMKIVGSDSGNVPYDSARKAESRASGIPWQNMNQKQACRECEEMGEGFGLINTAEWMTIARNIESVGKNWSDGVAHPEGPVTAKLNMGHTCRSGMMGVDCRNDGQPYSGMGLSASANDADGCFGYVKGDYEQEAPALNAQGWNLYRRTHYLTNKEVVWDFSGNLWDWTDWWIPEAMMRPRNETSPTDSWFEINAALPTVKAPEESFRSANPQVPSTINGNGYGRIHPGAADSASGVAMRGGNYMHGSYNNGIYAIGMGYGPDSREIKCEVGFRCVFRPASLQVRSKGVSVRGRKTLGYRMIKNAVYLHESTIGKDRILNLQGKVIARGVLSGPALLRRD